MDSSTSVYVPTLQNVELTDIYEHKTQMHIYELLKSSFTLYIVELSGMVAVATLNSALTCCNSYQSQHLTYR